MGFELVGRERAHKIASESMGGRDAWLGRLREESKGNKAVEVCVSARYLIVEHFDQMVLYVLRQHCLHTMPRNIAPTKLWKIP